MATLPKQSPLPLYETECTRTKNAPRPERNGTLFLEIDVDDQKAKIDCRELESVGFGKNRKVIFSSNKPCMLVFDNKGGDVFGMTESRIPKGETPLFINDDVVGWTHCSVKPLDRPTRIPEEFQCPPRIEVP
jgi:hypothetical protein